jgi:hypothetical protein
VLKSRVDEVGSEAAIAPLLEYQPMSTIFYAPELLARVIREHWCIEFSQLTRTVSKKHWDKFAEEWGGDTYDFPYDDFYSSFIRPHRKRVARALSKVLESDRYASRRIAAWRPKASGQPRSNWHVLWSTHWKRTRFPINAIVETLEHNWGMIANDSDSTIDVFFHKSKSDDVINANPISITAELILVEHKWARLNGRWVRRGTHPVLGPPDFGDLSFANQASSIRFAAFVSEQKKYIACVPMPTNHSGNKSFQQELKDFLDAALGLGYQCEIISPKTSYYWPNL